MFNSKYFKLGQVLVTGKINIAMSRNLRFANDVIASMKCHCNGDWGCLDAADKACNDNAVESGMRIFSAYETRGGKIYIITEADRSATTILFPDEY